MKTWKVEKKYINNSVIKCSCGIRKSVNNKKLDGYTCECVRKLSFDGNLKKLYREYRDSAKERTKEFKLSEAQFVYLTGLDCIYCGSPPTMRHFNAEFTGIDREDSSQGYTKDNVLPCCSTCNKMKGKMNVNDFFEQAIKISQRFKYIKEEVFEKEPKTELEIKELIEARFKLGFYTGPIDLLNAACEGLFDLNLIKYNLGESILDFPDDLNRTATHPNSFCRHKAFGKNLRIATKEIINRTNYFFEEAKKDLSVLSRALRLEGYKARLREKGLMK